MASKIRRWLFWKVALYYGVLIVSLLVLVGSVKPEWLKYLPIGGLEGLSNITEATAENVFLGQASASNQTQVFSENVLNLFSAMICSLIVAIPLRWVYMAKGLGKPSDPEIASGLLVVTLGVHAIFFCIQSRRPRPCAAVG